MNYNGFSFTIFRFLFFIVCSHIEAQSFYLMYMHKWYEYDYEYAVMYTKIFSICINMYYTPPSVWSLKPAYTRTV